MTTEHQEVPKSEVNQGQKSEITRRQFLTLGFLALGSSYIAACARNPVIALALSQNSTSTPSSTPKNTENENEVVRNLNSENTQEVTETSEPTSTETPTKTPEPTSTPELIKGITIELEEGSEYWAEAQALEKELREKELKKILVSSLIKENVEDRSIVIKKFNAINTSGETVEVIAAKDLETDSFIVPHFDNYKKRSGIDSWVIGLQMPRLGEQVLLIEDDYTVPSPMRPYMLNRPKEKYFDLAVGYRDPEGRITGRLLSWRQNNQVIRDNLSWIAARTLVRLGRPDKTTKVSFPAVNPDVDITPEAVNNWVDGIIKRSPIFNVDGLITNQENNTFIGMFDLIRKMPEDELKVLMSLSRELKMNIARGSFSRSKARELAITQNAVHKGSAVTLYHFFHEATHLLQSGSPDDREFVPYCFDTMVAIRLGVDYSFGLSKLVNATYRTSING